MGHEIYINYLASKEAHIGVLVRDSYNGPVTDMEFGRPMDPKDTRLLAFVSVFTDEPDFPDTSSINEVIDEGFKQIGTPAEAHFYVEPTKKGVFQFMWRPGFPEDSESAKRAIHEVTAILAAART